MGDPGEEPAAPERRDDGIDLRQIFIDLETDGPVAADEVVVVERMDEMAGHPLRAVLDHGTPALVVRRLHDAGAEPFDGAELGLGCGVHHHHAARRTDLARGERDALRGVTGAHGPDALRQLLRAKLSHRVIRAADLERSDRLQRFELEIDVRMRACRWPRLGSGDRDGRAACGPRPHRPFRQRRGWSPAKCCGLSPASTGSSRSFDQRHTPTEQTAADPDIVRWSFVPVNKSATLPAAERCR